MNAICKRLIDLILATVGLIVTSPVVAGIIFLLKLESPGSVIFSQERLGFRGRRFRLHKFRKFPSHWRGAGPGVTVASDARMTRIGALLERTKLDELPQLWNILKGEMSFVGPRPESLRYSDLFVGKYAEILNYKPGIFGPNQIAFRNESELYPADEDPETYYCRELFPNKAERDLTYFQKANCFKDILWIIRGIWACVIGTINWKRFLGFHSRILVVDIIMIEIAWTLAFYLRFLAHPKGLLLTTYFTGLWFFPPILLIGMYAGGCYRHPIRYFSFADAIRLFWVVTVAWMFAFLLFMGRFYRDTSFLFAPLGWIFLLGFLALPRVWNRLRYEKIDAKRPSPSHRLVIYGANNGGTALAAWMKSNKNGLLLLGFLDDEPEFRGKMVSGFKVLGRESDIPTVHEVLKFDEIWLTFQPDKIKRRRLETICERINARLVILPDLEPFSRFSA
jgi:lipopolysaccharide/colanic/teichoic acid biosynthesis glycosyltransferase